MIEVSSVPTGLRVADALVKAAVVVIRMQRALSPARYLVHFTGEVEAVASALAAGEEVAGSRLVGRLFLPDPHPALGKALGGRYDQAEVDALGIVETATVCAALHSLDHALKEDEVRLLELRLAMGLAGHGYYAVTGEVSAVECALDRARREAGAAVVDCAVIPHPDPAMVAAMKAAPSPFSDLP